LSSIDKELARDITVAWINCGKVSEEYLTKKQIASFYETMFNTIIECKAQAKGVQVIDTPTGTVTTSPVGVSAIRSSTSSAVTGRRSDISKHRF